MADDITYQPMEQQEAFVKHIASSSETFGGSSLGMLFAFAAVAVIVLELIINLIIISSTKSQLNTANRRIEAANLQLNSADLLDTQTRVSALVNGFIAYDTLKTSDRDYDPIFQDLKKYVIPNTRLKTFSINDKGVIKMDAEAKSFTDIAGFMAAMKQSAILTNIQLATLSYSDQAKSFSLTATYVPPKAASQATNATSP